MISTSAVGLSTFVPQRLERAVEQLGQAAGCGESWHVMTQDGPI
jgi:hypothetical protein